MGHSPTLNAHSPSQLQQQGMSQGPCGVLAPRLLGYFPCKGFPPAAEAACAAAALAPAPPLLAPADFQIVAARLATFAEVCLTQRLVWAGNVTLRLVFAARQVGSHGGLPRAAPGALPLRGAPVAAAAAAGALRKPAVRQGAVQEFCHPGGGAPSAGRSVNNE